MSKGIVYNLTNPCLDGWVKIGMTTKDNIDERLRELNSPSNIPLSYRAYAIYEVDDPEMVEKRIHSLIDRVDDSLHARETLASGKIREREFFHITPETAYGIFKDVALLRGDIANLKPIERTDEENIEEEIAEREAPRARLTFKYLGIPNGTELEFLYDESLKCTVMDDKNQVEYEGEQFSISALVIKLLIEKQGWNEKTHANGWAYFMYNGQPLTDMRYEIENAKDDN